MRGQIRTPAAIVDMFLGRTWNDRAELEEHLDMAYEAGFVAGVRRGAEPERLTASRYNEARMRWVRSVSAPAIEAVAQRHGTPVEMILGPRGTARVCVARAEAMWLMVERLRMTTTEAALAVGRTDHSTAIHAVRRVEERFAERPELRDELLALVRPALKAVA